MKVPTMLLTDRIDGTGATATIANSEALADNSVYVLQWRKTSLMGTWALAHRSEPTAAGLKPTSGTIAWRPRPDELVDVLPLIFGGTFAGTILEPAFITQGFPFSFDRKVKVMNSTGCKVARAEFSSQPGQSLRLSMQLEALSTAIANAGTFPPLSLSTMQPFQHHHSVLTFASTARLINSVKIGVDNGLDTSRFNTGSVAQTASSTFTTWRPAPARRSRPGLQTTCCPSCGSVRHRACPARRAPRVHRNRNVIPSCPGGIPRC
jgi:hypothetical protein